MYRPCSFIFPHPAFKTSFSFLATHMCMCMCMCMHMHMHMLYAWGVQLKTRKSRKKNRIKSKNKNNVELCSQCTSTLAAVTTGGNVRTMSDQHESSPCPARAPHEARPALGCERCADLRARAVPASYARSSKFRVHSSLHMANRPR